MKHSFISWDCSYRNFFHLIDGLLVQDYDHDQYELIYVEQRTREHADAYNHRFGLPSLWDRYEEVKDRLNMKVVYLNDPLDVSFHRGRINNAGIKLAQGEIISVMDGDQLLRPDFLTKLSKAHESHRGVLNLDRRMCQYPVGVRYFRDWTKGVIDFERCLNAVRDKNRPVPQDAGNSGPLISARREFWEATGGYDPHPIWSTSAAALGGEINRRLNLVTGVKSLAVPDTFSVHPWHPSDFLRAVRHEQDELRVRFREVLRSLMRWSTEHNEPHWQARQALDDQMLAEHRDLWERLIQLEPLNTPEGPIPYDNMDRRTLPVALDVWLSNWPYRNRFLIRHAVRAAAHVLSRWTSKR